VGRQDKEKEETTASLLAHERRKEKPAISENPPHWETKERYIEKQWLLHFSKLRLRA